MARQGRRIPYRARLNSEVPHDSIVFALLPSSASSRTSANASYYCVPVTIASGSGCRISRYTICHSVQFLPLHQSPIEHSSDTLILPLLTQSSTTCLTHQGLDRTLLRIQNVVIIVHVTPHIADAELDLSDALYRSDELRLR